ncbi:Rhodanese domain-containing protein [Chloropicon primus]|uniref:Rhodanese domain-containing protein n=1 Tax=Chloropicon primus TaxID=1764295 RepID=A0A5B8MF27_9CHLO|nr:hypothetical protein A3770_02p12820 [Chloropicon primus]UPQ97971.1 Rhodanese domain-containing protein [Chloropicon primus]|eukprot:QDZ18764.1 hypothetical protein A3770_02p12820 [Chloropicon primus]
MVGRGRRAGGRGAAGVMVPVLPRVGGHRHLRRTGSSTVSALPPEGGGREREVDLESLLRQGREESEDFVFSFDEDDVRDDLDWIDSKFEASIKPITEDEKESLAEKSKEIEAAATPRPREEEDHLESAYSESMGFKAISVQDLHDSLARGSMLLIDIRSRDEYNRYRARTFPWQSINIPFGEFSAWNRSGEFQKYKRFKLAIMCTRGEMSAQATVRLTRVYGLDGDKVRHVEGGINRWVLSGFGVEQTDLLKDKWV